MVGNPNPGDSPDEAASANIDRMKVRQAAHRLAGFLKDAETPGWESPEATSAWVRSLRRESDDNAFIRHEER